MKLPKLTVNLDDIKRKYHAAAAEVKAAKGKQRAARDTAGV